MIVLLPEPLAPTKAVVLLAGISRLMPFNTCVSGREGYEKERFSACKCPWHVSGIVPLSERGSRRDGLSKILNSSDAAAAPLVRAGICGYSRPIDFEARRSERTTL